MNKQKIVHDGQAYSAPRAESIEIKNQGVLCGSTRGFDSSSIKSFGSGSSMAGGSIKSWN